jgi:hypothetical protein
MSGCLPSYMNGICCLKTRYKSVKKARAHSGTFQDLFAAYCIRTVGLTVHKPGLLAKHKNWAKHQLNLGKTVRLLNRALICEDLRNPGIGYTILYTGRQAL